MSTHNGRKAAARTYCDRLRASSGNEIEQVIQRAAIEFLHYFTGLSTHARQEQWINVKKENGLLIEFQNHSWLPALRH